MVPQYDINRVFDHKTLKALIADRGCGYCEEAAMEYHILANSIRYTGSQSDLGRIFFVTVDYDQHGGDEVFKQMKLKTGNFLGIQWCFDLHLSLPYDFGFDYSDIRPQLKLADWIIQDFVLQWVLSNE